MSICHLPTCSILKPLSSSNSRTQESKEGLNGSMLVDETHVVDRAMMKRVSRTGISRSEPLRLEVTTAGTVSHGYGHERYEYAKDVLAGRADCQHLFAAPRSPARRDGCRSGGRSVQVWPHGQSLLGPHDRPRRVSGGLPVQQAYDRRPGGL